MSSEGVNIFISYSREDGEFALQLAADLRQVGVDLWIDQLDLRVGERWDKAIERALENCKCLLVVLSPSSIVSENVMDEVAFALEEGKQVLPVLYRTCKIPFRLRRLQRVDFTESYPVGLAKILKFLNVELMAHNTIVRSNKPGAKGVQQVVPDTFSQLQQVDDNSQPKNPVPSEVTRFTETYLTPTSLSISNPPESFTTSIRKTALPFLCKKCEKEMWSYVDIVDYWGEIYCQGCNPGK
jgi:TIR domain.